MPEATTTAEAEAGVGEAGTIATAGAEAEEAGSSDPEDAAGPSEEPQACAKGGSEVEVEAAPVMPALLANLPGPVSFFAFKSLA